MIRCLALFILLPLLSVANEFVLVGNGASIVIEHDGKSEKGSNLEIVSYAVVLVKDKKIVTTHTVENPKKPIDHLPMSVLFENQPSGKYSILARAYAKDWPNNPSELSTPFFVEYNADKPKRPIITIKLNRD